MWLLSVRKSKAGLPLVSPHLPLSRWYYSWLSRNGSYDHSVSSVLQQMGKWPLRWMHLRSQKTYSHDYELGALSQKLHYFTLHGDKRMTFTPFLYNIEMNFRVPILSGHSLHNASAACFHSSTLCRDIPDYLKGSISEVSNIEEDLLDDYFEKDMEEEILDFLNSHLLLYEETESSFMVPCPTCSVDDQVSRSQEIFVDKNSGYYVCPGCCQSGMWEELRHLLDVYEDTITEDQLSAYLSATSHISEIDVDVLKDSPLQAASLSTLEKCGAKLTDDGMRVVFPLKSNLGSIVGFESVSLLHAIPQVVRRYVMGKEKPCFSANPLNHPQKIVVVPNCCDVVTLAEYEIPAVSLPFNDVNALFDYLSTSNRKEVYLWLGLGSPPRQLLQYLVNTQTPSWIIKCDEDDPPIYTKSLKEVKAAMKDTTPVLLETMTTFANLRDTIYHRLTNKDEVYGVQWKRFSKLNEILLGHRPGEMTVLTGPTGSGKTTLMAEYSLDLCSQGVVTLWGSFEISIVRLCEIMLQQYSGRALPMDFGDFSKLATMFSNIPLHFLTYHGQQTTDSVLKSMTEAVKVWGVQHVIIDNLQFMLGTSEHAGDRWWEQDKAVASFRRFATMNNCHVTLIVHPKKVPEGQLLGMESIFGGAKVTQEADNVLILQVKDGSTVNKSKKALQVVKNRYGGQLGVLPLKFHQESLTLSSFFGQKSKTEKDKDDQESKKDLSLHKAKGFAFMN